MLYRVLQRQIERGAVEGLEAKIDIFFAAGKLTTDEYNSLIALLSKEE